MPGSTTVTREGVKPSSCTISAFDDSERVTIALRR